MKINWKNDIILNGERVAELDLSTLDKPFSIILKGNIEHIEIKPKSAPIEVPNENNEITYKITVKPYMTKPASPEFDFMAKWNNNIPMPLITMVGTKVKETRGMVYMQLHADITDTITTTCMKCGKPITNAVSQYFGMGPVCGEHNYTNPFDSKEELADAVRAYRETYLKNITWEGWVIKSAIKSEIIVA